LDLISQFISRYRKEFDFYEQACRIAAQALDSSLQSAGLRAIVTSRAKNPTRLETKVRQRSGAKSYATVEEIYEDIIDLAGVRVALYFPAEREEVGRIIKSLFVPLAEPKEFPTAGQPTYKKRFSGYWATHYRVRLAENLLNEAQMRYSEAPLEIQVASVLMHAWSEVEHDLVYKPLQGRLSEDEYAILDELNGLVLAGEIALERLQRAGESRISVYDREYTNHYDLASSLLELSREKLVGLNIHGSVIGRVDLLFQLLKELKLNTPQRLAQYVSALHSDFESRPLAEQIIDQVLSEDVNRYSIFEHIRMQDVPVIEFGEVGKPGLTKSEAIGEFISHWIDYEKMIQSKAVQNGMTGVPASPIRLLHSIGAIPPDLIVVAEQLQQFRNRLVHGIHVPKMELIRLQTSQLRKLTELLQNFLDMTSADRINFANSVQREDKAENEINKNE
jgi:ppGpp synthetase/RelA/SpoT-type nucleotidyltranferase